MIYDPIIITGVPRSRTSMVCGILEKCGVYFGNTCGSTPFNKRGQYEQTEIIQEITKQFLRKLQCDPKGQKTLPDTLNVPLDEGRREKFIKIFKPPQNTVYAFKDCKAVLEFPAWLHAFPAAKWIIVDRNADDIAKSCLKTNFMNAYDVKANWMKWIVEYRKRLDWLHEVAPVCFRVNSDRIVNFDFSEIRPTVKRLGLEFNEKAVKEWIDPSLSQI